MLNNASRSNSTVSIHSSHSSSNCGSLHSHLRFTSSQGSSSKHTSHLTSSLLHPRTSSPASTHHTTLPSDSTSSSSLVDPQISSPTTYHHLKRSKTNSQSSDQSSILFGTPQLDRADHSHPPIHHSPRSSSPHHHPSDPIAMTNQASTNPDPLIGRSRRLPSFSYTADDESIEELLKTLGYGPGPSRPSSQASQTNSTNPPQSAQSRSTEPRPPVVMMDIDGREFSIHEHSLSPVSERTELETSSSKTSHSKRRPLVQTVLSQRLHSEHGLHPVAPLSLSPKPKHLSTPSSPSSPYRSPPASSTPSKLADRPRDSRPLSEPQKLATLPPRSSSPAQIKSTHLFSSPPGSISPGRPSIHRLPKKTSHLIQLFENSLASSSPPKLPISTSPHHTAIPSSSQPAFTTQNRSYTSIPVEHPDRGSSPHSPASPLQARNQSKFSSMDPLVGRSSSPHLRSPNVSLRASSPHSPGLNSMDRLDPTSLPAPSMTEMECLRQRQERRERIAMAVKNHTPHSPSRLKINDATSKLDISSPRSDHPLKHRKSVASSLTSRISDRVLHAGTIWYRNPKANRWRETRGILTPEALYLMNEHGEVDPNVPDQSIELSLSGCTSVESVRIRGVFGMWSGNPTS